ncbi:protein of unknown function [Taphrina deformans PYCC 5710]|uniref:Uncharacterized protein n=1 Tax=Taphrina deformans (strain PYCC 5710 / ATCC 11124 / CBS 356.35 / IMI 108563 / JCM 9778 / NBRC 8474) TaxID=1097556 RepID=R4X6A0_TAPDE|nr:protein of unknown function [Taphrina deformans PYCC 5710]|eukprot:CCG80529.1 protein of unknown function [Taphrina deformans PYCC 5710]
MTTLYPQLLQQFWQQERNRSHIDELMRPYQQQSSRHTTQPRRSDTGRVISRIRHAEEQDERESLNIRNFGYHWLKPLGTTKTMGQIADEDREIHDSYEEYEDEDGEFNQNNPDITGAVDGQEIASEGEHDDEEVEEEADLDQEIEEGASFDVGDASLLSSAAPSTPAVPSGSGLYTTINGVPYIQSPDGSLVPIRPNEETYYEQGDLLSDAEDEGMVSAEEGSIGDYSTEEVETESESAEE